MRMAKRVLAMILMVCMVMTMLPSIALPTVKAASKAGYRYELDTNGIDVGAQYLIVSGTGANASALRMDSASSWNSAQTKVTVIDGNVIEAFDGDGNCTWSFSSTSNGTVSNNGYYLAINSYTHYQTSQATLQFASFGSGRYGIYTGGGRLRNLMYLWYNSSDDVWETAYIWGKNGTDASAYNDYVYLYKRVEVDLGYTVSYDGNGNTVGEVPAADEGLDEGASYTVKAPISELRKEDGDDTYLFRCWNTKADGTGTEYVAGDTITVTDDITLYAEWYLQTKYQVSVITDLDGVPTDMDKILGFDVTLYVKSDAEGSKLIELTKIADGTYVTYVTENGTYYLYTAHGDEEPEQEHGHRVVIFNQDGSTELLNYSVRYDENGGAWADGEQPATQNYHANTPITAVTQVPTRDGYEFKGWKDQNGKVFQPGETVTAALTEPTVLTAVWDDLMNVTVHVTVNSVPASGGQDNADDAAEVVLQLLQEHNGVNQPFGEAVLLDETHDSFDEENGVYTYTYVFKDLPQGVYNISAAKHGYEMQVTRETLNSGDEVIDVIYTYVPDDFDLNFDVVVDMDGIPATLRPQAVNVKVLYWGFDEDDRLGWHTITQQAGDIAPFDVMIDENGKGTGFYPVWEEWSEEDEPYLYRVEVTSFVLPDGSVVPVAPSNDQITYTPDGSGLYTATVTIKNGGTVPTYPPTTDTKLEGAYFDGKKQVGTPTVTVKVNPFTVTLDAGEGTINGGQSVVLFNQYRYPDLNAYIPQHPDDDYRFIGWYVNGELAENQAGAYLTENITYEARFSPHVEISGTVYVRNFYEQDGETVTIPLTDQLQTALVVLKKNINGVYNDVDSQLVTFTYRGTVGTGTYAFELPNDGTEYAIEVLTYNFGVLYDNNGDVSPNETEFDAIVGADNVAIVNAYLLFEPDDYAQYINVDASRIEATFRPSGVLTQVLYRDQGDSHPYAVISQHTAAPFGVQIALDKNGKGSGFEDVWKWHNDGTLYEYQANLYKLYGNVPGVFTEDGTLFDQNSPFTVEYGKPTYWIDATNGATAKQLNMTLVPKEYIIEFDLNVDDDHAIQGMDKFHADNGEGHTHFTYAHTWSFKENVTAFPYRDGYVFMGWESNHDGVVVTDHGNISIGATVAETVTLTAQWEPLEGTDYSIRHLELNTDKVLHGAQAVSGSVNGTKIAAADASLVIDGYEYAGAMINGTYYDKTENPQLTVTDNPTENLMIVYYLPDGSDGYTEQVESNLGLDKQAILENDGTYTIQLETFTKDNPISTFVQQNTPLDIVLVLDQSGSIINSGYLDELQAAVNNFVGLVATHGRDHEVDHRIAIVGYAGDEDCDPTSTNTNTHPIAGGTTSEWVNTGVFDSNGDFHPYPVTGFNYTAFTGTPTTDGIYYAYSDGEYLLLTYHKEYRHLITETEAILENAEGTQIYGYAGGEFVKLTRNTSGLWLYGDKQLYSSTKFFTYHQDVWTHRKGLEGRQIHAYGSGDTYRCEDGHDALFTRDETRATGPQLSVYHDALVPVSVGANGSGGVNPGLSKSISHLGSNGGTYVQYGIEMANRVFEANPLDPTEGRVRIMVMFTDGLPGTGTFDSTVANEAIEQAYIAKNTHKAYSYTIGLYPSNGVNENSNEAYYMHAVSSNYPTAQNLNDVKSNTNYVVATDGTRLNSGGPYYVKVNNVYCALEYGSRRVGGSWWGGGTTVYGWRYTYNNQTTYILDNDASPAVENGQVAGYTIYKQVPPGYESADDTGYYSTTDSEQDLKDYFAHVMTEITTKITTEIILHEDTILRDIMGQGLVLTPGTVINAYKQPGTYNAQDNTVTWFNEKSLVATVTIPEGNTKNELFSSETTTVQYTLEDGTQVVKENVPYISVYNLMAENATNPNGDVEYHPHTVDITGYDFENWCVSESHPNGYKMVVEITRVEARDDVEWGRATDTNNSQSGLWLPADKDDNRKLLQPFDQPSTIFVERVYVLDYAKEFELSGWYFDDEDGQTAEAIHLDMDITNGMNWFDSDIQNEAATVDGDAKHGKVRIEDDKVYYAPTGMQWGDYDQFYVFGNTWRRTVKAQDANENGNLWNKVVVIPANNVYYEDSFVTSAENGIDGFTFTGAWKTVYTDGDPANADKNTETPEHQESDTYGDVHGWTDTLDDDKQYSDGSAHVTGQNGERGSSVEFTFTGTGVDVYTRTNNKSGMVVATLTQLVEELDDEGNVISVKKVAKPSIIMDNLAMSGDYYQIPTISFTGLAYGTYTVKLIATSTSAAATGEARFEYYVDGVRVYNPMGHVYSSAPSDVKNAYGHELNAIFTEVRDILLDYGDFHYPLENDEEGKAGALFIDWIKDGQESGNDQVGTAQPSYEIGTFEDYGPKNEVYLSAGQAIVLKVDPDNHYFVGLKSLTGAPVTAKISGLDQETKQEITLEHTTDMYYRVIPTDGYIVIQNGSDDGSVLSITKLRTTNPYISEPDNGVQPVVQRRALMFMSRFAAMPVQNERETAAPETPQPQPPVEEEGPSAAELHAAQVNAMTEELFVAVRGWLDNN